MATKQVELAGIGPVMLVKSPRSRSIRLSVNGTTVRVSMPTWTPYAAGKAFAQAHVGWIASELAKQALPPLKGGQRVGKLHRLRFEPLPAGATTATKVTATEVVVRIGSTETIADATVQQRVQAACTKALKREAALLLPPRLQALAAKHNLTYASVAVKRLKRRWGSCSSTKAITLNIHLMDLTWEYIDYVLCHELAHTVHMNHGPEFWKLLTRLMPRARDISRELRAKQPVVGTDEL